eukprot:gene14283-10_t
MVPTLLSSPALASSPPTTRSQAWPINKRLSKSAQASVQPDLQRRTSDTAAAADSSRRLSFGSRTPAASSLSASAKSCSSGRPPVGAGSKPASVCVGFSPAESSSSAALSPGRLATKSSLLSKELLLSGGCCLAPSSFQGLVVLPQRQVPDTVITDRGLLQLQAQHPVFYHSTVTLAYDIAARAHAGQLRKSGETVLSHCAAAALILAELGLSEEVVAAGLLHDVLCDTFTQAAELSQQLPASVVSLVTKVAQLNQLSQTYRDNTHSLEAEAMLDMLTGMDDVSALLIKLADRLHNMRTIGSLARCKQVRMASETLDVFAVLANRLGAWSIKAELEDLSFKTLNPEEYDMVAEAIAALQEMWQVMPGRVKDYIRNRKANGYQSLHLTVRDGRGQPLEVQIRTPKMHYIAEYGFAAHWKYKERLGRQDLWLDRLVQWKKWVASEKLGIVDKKMRSAGSPGSGGDAALAGLAARLGLESAVSGGSAAGAMASVLSTLSAGDAVGAELEALGAGSSFGRGVSRGQAVVAAAAVVMSSSPADEKFAARFRMQPISEAEVYQHGASVLVSGPRGVHITQVPARCTVGQLLGSRELTDQLRRAGSGGLSALPGASGLCRLAVNGVVVMPSQAQQVVLRSGDQVQLLEDPSQPMLPDVVGGDGSGCGGVTMAADSAGVLPLVMADAGENLQLFVPGQGEAIEVALKQKLSVAPRVPVRSAALVL